MCRVFPSPRGGSKCRDSRVSSPAARHGSHPAPHFSSSSPSPAHLPSTYTRTLMPGQDPPTHPHPHSQAPHPRSPGHPPQDQDPGGSKRTHPWVSRRVASPRRAPGEAPTAAKSHLPGSGSVWGARTLESCPHDAHRRCLWPPPPLHLRVLTASRALRANPHWGMER